MLSKNFEHTVEASRKAVPHLLPWYTGNVGSYADRHLRPLRHISQKSTHIIPVFTKRCQRTLGILLKPLEKWCHFLYPGSLEMLALVQPPPLRILAYRQIPTTSDFNIPQRHEGKF